MTRTLTMKSCHVWGAVWLCVMGALIYPLVLNTSNVLTLNNENLTGHTSYSCFHDFYNAMFEHCGSNSYDFVTALYVILIGNICLLVVAIYVGLYWLNGHYEWISLNVKSCWTK